MACGCKAKRILNNFSNKCLRMHQENRNRNLFKNFFSQSILQIANNVLPIISIPIIVRIIGPDKFGVINFATVIVSYFILLTNYGFDLTATRDVTRNKDSQEMRSQIFNEVLIAKLFLFAISTILFLILLNIMPQLYNEKKVAVYSFLIVFSFVLTPTWLYQGMQQLYNLAIFSFVTKLLFTICVLFFIRQKSDYPWQPLLISVSHILVGAAAFLWALKKYKVRLFFVPFKRVLARLWNERLIFASFVSINIYIYASTIIIGLFQKSEDVAFFASGYRLVVIMHTIVTIPIGMSLFPYIGESFAMGTKQGIVRVQSIAPIIFYATLIMGIGVWLLAPFIIAIFYGDAFGPAVKVLRILCFLPVFLGMTNLLGVQTLVNLKMDKVYTTIIFIGALIGIVLSLWLVKQYSFVGGAWALLLTEFSILIILWCYLKRLNFNVLEAAYFRPAYVGDMLKDVINRFSKKSK